MSHFQCYRCNSKASGGVNSKMAQRQVFESGLVGRLGVVGETNCPSCGTDLTDGATVAGHRHLSSRDVSICRGCGEIVILSKADREVTVRHASASEYLSLPEDSQTLLRVAFTLVKRARRQSRVPRHLN
jgi:hypothetical protein